MRKVCTKCNTEKPLEDFYRDRTRKDGRAAHCGRCQLMRNRKRDGIPLDAPIRKRAIHERYTNPTSPYKLNKLSIVKSYEVKANKITKGELEDDFTNHLFSHFGFNDVAPETDRGKGRLETAQGGRVNNYGHSSGMQG